MIRWFKFILNYSPLILVGSLLAGCTGYQPTPTPTVAPTNTRRPTETLPPTSTATPTGLPTPEPTAPRFAEPKPSLPPSNSLNPPLSLGDTQTIREAGFSFRTVDGFEVNRQEGQVTLVSQEGDIILSLAGGPSGSALERVMDRLLEGVGQEFEDFEASDPYPITIDNSRGLAADVSGELTGQSVSGQLAVVSPAGQRVFYAFGFTVDTPEGDRWETQGSEVFEAVMDSVDFFDPSSGENP